MSAINTCCGQVLGHTRWCQRDRAPFPNEDEGWMQTFTGKKFFPLKPNVDDICIEDIAHHLSMLCRYNGATKMYYSVAQHSVLVSKQYEDRGHRLAGLLHDASEAYFGDFIRPLKYQPEFKFVLEADERLQELINAKFGLEPFAHTLVKDADIAVFLAEAHTDALMSPRHPDWKLPESQSIAGFSPWSPETAEAIFLREFTSIFYAGGDYATDFVQGRESPAGA